MEKQSFIGLMDDQPQEPEKGLIPNLQDMVDRLLPLLQQEASSEPVLISGYWGSGKTSVMKALKLGLDESSKQRWVEPFLKS